MVALGAGPGLVGLSGSRWTVAPPVAPEVWNELPHLSPVIVQLLVNRSITIDEADAFLHAGTELGNSPFLLRGMTAAVARIRQAIAAREKIVVYGDFDVDGVTACAVMTQTLEALGAICQGYIPHRTTEGYGLNAATLAGFAADGVRLVVTVDCGSGSVDEVRQVMDLGLDVVITDHHVTPLVLPEATAVVNPQQPGCRYPFKQLAGVGVAYKVAQALVEGTPQRSMLRDTLDLVAIGSIADMAPLRGENRMLVKAGLAQLNGSMRLGIQALAHSSKVRRGLLTAFDIGYRISPRLNAAGRIDHASLSYRLLTTNDPNEAETLARVLDEKNQERQRVTGDVLEAARLLAESSANDKVLVLAGDEWPSGVIGLVAGRLSEEMGRPVFVIDASNPVCRGSARGQGRLDVHATLAQCDDLLIAYGGHSQAAGFSIDREMIPALRQRLLDLADRQLGAVDGPEIQVDAEVRLADLTLDLCDALAELEPFGVGNPVPTLLCRNLRVLDSRIVGDDHLRLVLGSPRQSIQAMAWRQGGLVGQLPRQSVVDVLFNLEINEWDGMRSPQMKVRDLVIHSPTAHTKPPTLATGTTPRLSAAVLEVAH